MFCDAVVDAELSRTDSAVEQNSAVDGQAVSKAVDQCSRQQLLLADVPDRDEGCQLHSEDEADHTAEKHQRSASDVHTAVISADNPGVADTELTVVASVSHVGTLKLSVSSSDKTSHEQLRNSAAEYSSISCVAFYNGKRRVVSEKPKGSVSFDYCRPKRTSKRPERYK